MAKEVKTIEQQRRFCGRRSFTIRDDSTVVAKYDEPGFHQELTINLAGLNANATHQKYVAVNMLVGVAIFLLPTLSFLWGTINASFGTATFYWFLGAFLVFLLPVGLCWREYIRQSFDLLVFTEPMTGNRLILYRNTPDEDTVAAFINTLQTAIQKAREQVMAESVRASSLLSHELERLAALRDKGVLSDAEFQKAKTVLLDGLNEKPRIGFHVG